MKSRTMITKRTVKRIERKRGSHRCHHPIATSTADVGSSSRGPVVPQIRHKTNTRVTLNLLAVLWAVVIVQMWSHSSLIICFNSYCNQNIDSILEIIYRVVCLTKSMDFNSFIQNPRRALFNPILQNIYNYFLIGDRLVIVIVNSYSNSNSKIYF